MHAGLGHAGTAGAERVLTRHYSAGMPGHGAQAYRPFAGQPTHEDMRQSLIAKIRVLVAADSSPDLTCVRATHIDLSYQPIFTSLRAPLISGTSTQSTLWYCKMGTVCPPRIRESRQMRRGCEGQCLTRRASTRVLAVVPAINKDYAGVQFEWRHSSHERGQRRGGAPLDLHV